MAFIRDLWRDARGSTLWSAPDCAGTIRAYASGLTLNSSRFRPSSSSAFSHRGAMPRPDQASPFGPWYFAGRGIPASKRVFRV